MRTLSLRLPEVLAAKLSAIAKRRGATKSAVVREALEAFTADEQQPRPGSFADLAKDLLGSVEGPGDLSYNPEHMEGFGE